MREREATGGGFHELERVVPVDIQPSSLQIGEGNCEWGSCELGADGCAGFNFMNFREMVNVWTTLTAPTLFHLNSNQWLGSMNLLKIISVDYFSHGNN